jgi:cell division protein FtsB
VSEESSHGVRIASVEKEVSNIRSDLTGLKADVRGLSSILSRIEAGVTAAQQQWQDERVASRINPIALTTVLISIISILVGGAWLVSGGMSTTSTRLDDQEKFMSQMIVMRDRELNLVERRIDRLEVRGHGEPQAANP